MVDITPCIGICKLTKGICIGCKRTSKQISEWQNYDNKEKKKIINNLKLNIT
ncbi:DUF1289 domain-containing protein [Alphaproteobacteria bacterium]|jgi:predicted Fe-S protein YdhL (DUF1289 family)|nr:DUF1289 domain-containing protein [Alphaproteobacteria bacterium]